MLSGERIFLRNSRADDGGDDKAELEHHFELTPNVDFRMEPE